MIKIENEYLKVRIDEVGGSLDSIENKANGKEYLWQGDKTYWEEKAPNLFPFIGRLFEQNFTHNGKEYEMKLHGFLRSEPMQVENLQENSVTLSLDGEKWVRENKFPLSFKLHLIWSLEKSEITCLYKIENTSDEILYCAVGGHPGINIPLDEGLRFEDYRLEFSKKCEPKRVVFSSSGLTTDVREECKLDENNGFNLKHNLFDNDAIVLTDTPHEVKLFSKNGNHGVKMKYTDMPYIGFWQAEKTDAPYLCLEPWTSLPGRDNVHEELSHMNDRIKIAPRETKVISWSLEVF
jgi:galactose mutarotase-like enzyme